MKNITVTVDDALYQRARIKAAERGTTVSAMVREFLEGMVEERARFERMKEAQNALIQRIRAEHLGFSAAERLTRDELHRRDALR